MVDLPPGTKVTPISALSDEEVAELKKKGVRGLQDGGVIDFSAASFPLGVRNLLGGGGVDPTRSILPAAGLRVPSAQAQRNLLPLEREFLMELALQAGIPEAEFREELGRQGPGFGGGRATFRPRF